MKTLKATKDKKVYKCDQCGEPQLLHWIELKRKMKPRCPACGCARLEKVEEEKSDDA